VVAVSSEIIQDFISFGFCAVFLYWLWVLFQAASYKTPALGIPVWVPQLGIAIGFILMLFYFLAHFIKGVRDLVHPQPTKDE
jgi:TRAP-type C4-dicarboxylate transport system permease small subunit